MSERMFRMRAPNSEEEAVVPESKVNEYRKRGAVVVASVRTPERANWLANQIDAPTLDPRIEQMHDFVQRGAGIDPRVPYAMVKGFGAGAAQSAADLLEGAKAGFMSTVLHGGDLLRRATGRERIIDRPENVDAMTPPDSLTGKIGYYAEQGAEYLAPSARALTVASKIAPVTRVGSAVVKNPSLMRRAAAAGTVMGADAGWAGVQTGGDPTAMAIGAAAPPVIGGALRAGGALARAGQAMASGAAEGGVGGAVAGALRRAAPEEPTRMIVQAVKPRNSQVNFESVVATAAPRIKQVAGEMGLPLNSIDDVLAAAKAAKRTVRAQFDEVAGPMRQMGVDLSPVADQQIASIPRSLQVENPAAYRRAVERANSWRRVATVEEAEQFLRESNAQLEGHFAKFSMSQRKQLLADPRIAGVAAKAQALRDTIYSALDNPALPDSARTLNRQYGQLMEFEDSVLRRANVAKRQQPESLSEQIGTVRAVADMARGGWKLMHGDVFGMADIAAGRAGNAAAKYLKEQQTTDALLRRAFERIEPAAPFAPVPARPVAGLLERGSIPMAPSPDGSYVRGVPAEPARREIAGYLPSSTTASQQFEMPPSSEADATVQAIDADRVVQRDPRTGQMQRVYTGEEAGTAKQRSGSPYTPVLSVMPNAAAGAIEDDPDSQLDDYARAGLNIGGAVALGAVAAKSLKGARAPKAPKPEPFEFAPLDEKALARQESFKRGQISFARLPKEARPTFIYNEILNGAGNGISVQPLTGQRVTPGQPGPAMAGVFPNSDKRTMSIPLADFKPRHVEKFVMQNKSVFAKDPHAFIGGWLDKKTNTVYLDVSTGFLTKTGEADVRGATKFAETQNPGRVGNRMNGKTSNVVRQPDGTWPRAQDAVFDPMSNNPSGEMFPPVGNFYEFINSPEFRDRVVEMAAIGRRAMGGENPEWWNIVNGPMARVYGKQNIEAVAGYLASTSPQNGPEANLKMMTELMRRHIKGEPVRQPNWRAPETAMGKIDKDGNRVFNEEKGRFVSEGFAPSAGQKFPNENTYANNAEKVRAGRANTVTDDKVNDMFHALMGHLVGVFDRHWAKIAEKPSAGIYADKVINRLAGSMDSGRLEAYPVVENRVRDLAKEAGVDISKYSAWVWEGIRKTIRDTGELFGQKHRASAVPETTTGFNELFERLVSAKAKHLGVSVPKLEEMLRNGDAELLALLLSTPIGAAAYSRWRAGGDTTPEGRGPS
jgi:hypothetical protein